MFLCYFYSCSFFLPFVFHFWLYLSSFIHYFKSFYLTVSFFFPPKSCHIVVVKTKKLLLFRIGGICFFIFSLLIPSEHLFFPIKPWELMQDFLIFSWNQPKNAFDFHTAISSSWGVPRCLLRSHPCEASQAELLWLCHHFKMLEDHWRPSLAFVVQQKYGFFVGIARP